MPSALHAPIAPPRAPRPVLVCLYGLAALLLETACRHPPPSRVPTGCLSDSECKLDRICEDGRCVWPARPVVDTGADSPDGGPAINGEGQAAGDLQAPPDSRTREGAPPASQRMFQGGPTRRGRVAQLLPGRAPSVVWRYRTGGPVTATPTVLHDGGVAVGSHDGKLHVLDPIGQARFLIPTGDIIFSTPAIDRGDRLYFGSGDDHLYAVNLARGSLDFRIKLGDCSQTRGVGPEQTRCDVDGGPTLGPDGTIYVGGAGVFAIKPDGSIKWRFPTRERVPTAPALLPDGTVLAGSLDDTFYAIAPDGQKRWDFRAGGDIESSPALTDDGLIVFGCDDDKVYALNDKGELQWAFSTGGDVRASPAIGRDGSILAGAFDGLFYAISPAGVLAWTFRTADRIASSALVDGQGAILFGSQDDRLYALEANGHLRWSVELGGDVDSSPALGPDGTIYVGSDDRFLYSLRSPD